MPSVERVAAPARNPRLNQKALRWRFKTEGDSERLAAERKVKLKLCCCGWWLIGPHTHTHRCRGEASWPAGWSQLKYLQYVQSSKEWNDCQQHFPPLLLFVYLKESKVWLSSRWMKGSLRTKNNMQLDLQLALYVHITSCMMFVADLSNFNRTE